MKVERFKRFYSVILMLLFVFLITFVHLTRYYDDKVTELNKKIFVTAGKGFSLFNAYKNVDIEGDEVLSRVYINLEPGDSFEGLLGIKNHELVDHLYKVKDEPFIHIEKGELKETPIIEFERKDFKLAPEEVVFFSYTVKAPEGIEDGEYVGQALAVVSDSTAEKIVEGPVILDVAVGVNIYVNVGEGLEDREYVASSDHAENYALKLVFLRLMFIVGGVLLLLAFYFIYLAFYYEKNKKRGKKKK